MRFRLYPTPAQEAELVEHCRHARFVWNLALEQANCWRRHWGSTPGNAERMRQLTDARSWSWLGEGSATIQQQALRDFDQAMRNWWGGSHRRPTWRKKGEHEGFAVRDLTVRKLNRKWATILVPKVGPVRFRLSRSVPVGAKSARVTLDRARRWHVSFVAVPPMVDGPGAGSVVGIDRGVANTLALSTGEMYHAPEAVDVHLVARRLSRARRGSNRRQKAKLRVARLKARDVDRRKDWAEKATTDLARRFDIVRIEDLNIANMVRSVKGTVEAPGRNVRAKAGLNRAILASGWGLFARRLKDKIGDRLELVPAAYTSQRCSCCGWVDACSRESQARFVCTLCGHSDNADVNAARNIAAGHAVTGRGGIGKSSEPLNRQPQLAASG